MDLTVYDRRAWRIRLTLAVGLVFSGIVWYLADFHNLGLGEGRVSWLVPAAMLVAMLVIGVYANGLIHELRHHAVELGEQHALLRRLAQHDPMTGLLNRASFIAALEERVKQSEEGMPVALFLLDLDRFKVMNDVFGHAFGDAVLERVGEVLRRDIGDGLCGRLGGDEFAFMLSGPVSRSTCEAAGRRVLQALAAPTSILGRTTQIEGSIGVAWSPQHTMDRMDIVACADLALYLAKEEGRGRVACFDGELLKEERYRRSIERELRGALLMNELEMYYQPIHSADGARVTALEALVRWRHPVRGVISPAEFIAVAERSSLIEKLGTWVFTRVCEDMADWDDIKVSINVSPAQLKGRDFANHVRDILASTGRDPRRIAIEITENILMDNSAEQIADLNALRALGMSVWLDDFGTGHSGLSYLREFPIDVIKIDKGLVQDMRDSADNRVFVSTIAQLGSGLDRRVVAEGIETQDDLVLARAAGCSHVQGYYFSRPLEARNVPAYLATANKCSAAA